MEVPTGLVFTPYTSGTAADMCCLTKRTAGQRHRQVGGGRPPGERLSYTCTFKYPGYLAQDPILAAQRPSGQDSGWWPILGRGDPLPSLLPHLTS